MRKHSLLGLSALVACGLCITTVNAADRPAAATNNQANAAQVQTAEGVPMLKSSEIVGMKVRNSQNENVGKIDDLAVEAMHGDIRYAALGVGGFLGIGEKLFPVPWEKLTLKHDGKEKYFFFDVDKEKLKNSPGFSKTDWPFADPKFAESIDQYYSVHRVARPVERRTEIRIEKKTTPPTVPPQR